MKVVTVVGARPQFIKASAVSREFPKRNVEEVIVHTGQHYDANMSDIFFKELGIPTPRYNFEIRSSRHGEMTGRMLESIETVLLGEKPDWVLIYGDTNSTLAGALAAAKLHIPIAHVEAGLRSFNRAMPEEVNRIMADHLSSILFSPTELGRKNLISEGIPSTKISVVGDVMYDVSQYYGSLANKNKILLQRLGLEEKKFILLTCHRQENTDNIDRLKAIFLGLNDVAEKMPVVCPIHPRTKKYLLDAEWFKPSKELKLIDPIGYLDMVTLEHTSALIATDSGGVQKEAFFYEVPCVTLRDETEWEELIEGGWNILVPPLSKEVVRDGVLSRLNRMGKKIFPYGDGKASQAIVDAMVRGV
ncbi:non-hydrolyzing UDP-N-acetylglucosamine 2-epimerase [Bdellovibrio sp. BCCA]|uniref:non-hydrolyzing UDP-N-acetylglucosamine 2-epimerase n=1 Tax=Bdellovibrio sp. BCCA TaxID=3136281 RepID=UPI0030F1E273